MIIPAGPYPITGERLELADWLRAPLSMNKGARYYSVYDAQPREPAKAEIVISTIDPSLWDDIWRLEIVTKDEPGNLLLILSMLSHLNVKVIASEGSISASGRRHAMSFIVTCHGYESERDKSSLERSAAPRATLPDLEFIMKLNLVDQLGFTDKKHPRLRISRMDEFKRIFDDIRQGKRVIRPREGQRLRGKTIRLDMPYVEGKLGLGKCLLAMPAVDTKNRVVRVLIFEKGDGTPFHIQLTMRRSETFALKKVLDHLFSRGINILRYQLRPGMRAQGTPTRVDDSPARLDLLVEAAEGSALTGEEVRHLCAQISADRELKHYGVECAKSPGEF